MRRKAFTLIELLVVIAIIIVLVGLIVPVLSNSKGRATSTHGLQYLRQAGLAAEIYTSDHGYFDHNHNSLVAASYLSMDIIRVPSDATVQGWANSVRLSKVRLALTPAVPYKDSFLSIADFFPPGKAMTETIEGRNGGWLIVWNGCEPSKLILKNGQVGLGLCMEGPYFRLRKDSSVVARRINTDYFDNRKSKSIRITDYFCDH